MIDTPYLGRRLCDEGLEHILIVTLARRLADENW